ncbi:MAG: hypothetical protein Q9216_000780 [Gyalolechia sp. 2 TL-2023]
MSRHNRRRNRARHRNSVSSSQPNLFELPDPERTDNRPGTTQVLPIILNQGKAKRNDLSTRHRYMAWQARERQQKEERERLLIEQQRIFGGEAGEEDDHGLCSNMIDYFVGLEFLIETDGPQQLFYMIMTVSFFWSRQNHLALDKKRRADWTYHKYLCPKFKDFEERPDSNSVRAILFPDHCEVPNFVWLRTNDSVLDPKCVSEKVEAAEFLEVTAEEQIGQQEVMRGMRRRVKPGPSTTRTHLIVRADGLVDGSKPNLSIGTITKGNFLFSWRGPVLAVLTSLEDSHNGNAISTLGDMTMTDYGDLIDFFKTYGQHVEGQEDFGPSSFWWLAPTLKQEMITRPQIQVIKICCDVEQKRTGVKYYPFNIGEGHPAMVCLQPLPITASLGLPLIMRRFPTDDTLKAEVEATGNGNAGLELLLMCIDPKSQIWGKAPRSLVQGNMVVMRHDRKDLSQHHLEALFMYLLQIVCPAVEETLQPEPKREKAEVLDMLHPSRLDWYFRVFRKERSQHDESWRNTPDLFHFESEGAKSALEQLTAEFELNMGLR